ncbi:WXG100 family type VII secretion target [Agromyces atrinae]|uniref:WXG100 family type VII secretion target n=1 Tax=Agromyces atrinae TaxID=592376 RepID=UPI001F55E0B9|nr:WXG100 family type VII secretion target [Agromyces atrinae]MCI2956747.1 WXG100 family type VII secretion target [Agromyces atrinae]
MSQRLVRRFGQLDGLVTLLDTSHTDIRTALDELDARVSELRGSWTGDATDAYARAHAEWEEALAELGDVLADAARVIQTTAERGRRTEERIAAKWGAR